MFRTVLLCTVVVVALVPASAQAALVFDRHPLDPSVWVAADDGSGARRLATGSQPRISPDGMTIAYMVTGDRKSFRPDLMVVPADGSAPPRLLARGWRESFTFAWSPDSRTIAALVGPELGRRRLALIDVATGTRRSVADGFFSGVSFSPGGDEILYGRATSERYPVPATSGGRRSLPAARRRWRCARPALADAAVGPHGARGLRPARRRGPAQVTPRTSLYVMNPDGSGVARLTRTKVAQLLQGLTPTAWSADGTRLLAEFGGQDTSYAETVDPLTGTHKPVVKAVDPGFVGTDLSADGTTILSATGGFDPGSKHDVVTIPYGGGKPTVLARGAFDPDWNR